MSQTATDVLDVLMQAEDFLNHQNERRAFHNGRSRIICRHGAARNRYLGHTLAQAVGIGQNGGVTIASDLRKRHELPFHCCEHHISHGATWHYVATYCGLVHWEQSCLNMATTPNDRTARPMKWRHAMNRAGMAPAPGLPFQCNAKSALLHVCAGRFTERTI